MILLFIAIFLYPNYFKTQTHLKISFDDVIMMPSEHPCLFCMCWMKNFLHFCNIEAYCIKLFATVAIALNCIWMFLEY